MNDLLEFLNSHKNLEITWGDIDGWEDDCQWRVHRRNGGRNDAEWTLIGYGETVQNALISARGTIENNTRFQRGDE